MTREHDWRVVGRHAERNAYYAACVCGWCSPGHPEYLAAHADGVEHEAERRRADGVVRDLLGGSG